MGNGASEAQRLIDLAAERGLIPESKARQLRDEAPRGAAGERDAEWLVRRDVLTADQVAELRSALDTLERSECAPAADVPTVVLPEAVQKLRARAERSEKEVAVPEVAGYRIVGRLGEGGMGVVWRAVQLSASREVALKLLPASSLGSERARRRFEREVELTARLEHPNIARLYDSGLHRGVYYYAMEMVEGVPLDLYAAANRLSQAEILRIVQSVCEAVDYAHRRGVVHRDLKPNNVLVDPDGVPHVLDFGLAKALQREQWDAAQMEVTIEGRVSGTPAYMAPEQAAGRSGRVGPHSDVYSLGVITFRLLTHEYPHELSGSPLDVLRRVMEEEIRRPRQVSKDIDRELEALLLRAMARDPADRYSSAGELAADIGRYLSGEPMLARPPGVLYGLAAAAKRHSVALSVVAVLVVLLAARAGGLLQGAELRAYDAFLGLRPTAEPAAPVAIVGITEDDIRQLGHYPVTDREMADVLRNLVEAGARAVGLDIYRDMEVPPGRAELNRVLQENEQISAVMQFGGREGGIGPPPVLAGTGRIGFADQVVDPDGVVRRGLLFMDDSEATYQSLGLSVARTFLRREGISPKPDPEVPEHMRLGRTTFRPFEPDDGPYVDADAGGYQFLLDYRGPETFPTFSFGQALTGRLDPDLMRDCVVLVGVTAESVKDHVSVPGNPTAYGVQMQAICVDQLLRSALHGDRPPGVLPEWAEALWTAAAVIAGGLVAFRMSSRGPFLAAGAGGLLLLVGVACGLFMAGWWVPVLPPAVGWTAAWMLAGPYRPLRRRSG